MNKLKKFFAVATLAGLFLLPSFAEAEAGVRVYVRFGPPKVRTVRIVKSVRPCAKAIWVSAHWQYKHGRHVRLKGYWVKPRQGYVYVLPRWKKNHHGYYYIAGHWKRI